MLSRIHVMGVGALLSLLSFLLPTCSTMAANPRSSNPSSVDPDQALAVHGDDASVTLQAECNGYHMALAKSVPPMLKRVAMGQAAKNDPGKIAEAHTTIAQLTRAANQLLLLGEPAGYEFNLRASYFTGPLGSVIAAYNATPPGAQNATVARQRLARMERPREVTFTKLQELVKKKSYAEAERTWYEYLDRITELTIFLSPDEGTPYLKPFGEISSHIMATIELSRLNAAKESLVQRRDSQRPKIDELVARIATAAQTLASSPQVSIDDAVMTGPEAFTHFVSIWQRAHASAIRCQGLTWVLQTLRPNMGGISAMVPMTGPVQVDPALEAYRSRSASQVSQALAGLVEAEAARVAPAEVAGIYVAWLNAAAPHVGRVQNDALARALDPALLKLASRSPEWLAQVSAYDEITRDLLRWKRRTAEAATTPFVSQQPAIEIAARKAFTNGQGYVGLFAEKESDTPHPTFLAAAPVLLPHGAEQLLQQNVILNMGQGLGGGKSNATRMRMRTFATLKPTPEALATAVATLESDLLVTAEQPPLTLTAAAALRSLQLGDFVTCGGEVSGIHLEGYLTRLAALPDAAWPLFPLGDLPLAQETQGSAANSLDKAAIRCDIEPKWLRHEYAVVPMTPAQ